MKRTPDPPSAAMSGRRLCIAQSPCEAWDGAIRPWFDATLPLAWKRTLPSLVIVPTRHHAQALKARLLHEGRSHLGLRFVTPMVLRELLGAENDRRLPPREHLRLLLAIAADERLPRKSESDSTKPLDADALAAKAVVRAPDHLLRTLVRLDIAGWNFDRLEMQSFEPIINRFRQHLDASDFDLAGEIERNALRRAAQNAPQFASVLVTGFDSAHWPHWFLLRAAVAAAENATVVLDYPRGDILGIDVCWIGSWEEALGEAEPITKISDALFSETEMRGASPSSFLVGANTSEQAGAIALICLRYVAETAGTRIGIVFARAGALPRLVASALAGLKIPHNDGFAHPVPGLFESAEWRAWLELQRGPRIGSFLRFINALENRASLFPDLSTQALERTLRDAYAQVLIDDLDVLREFCAAQSGGTKPLVAEALHSLGFLPARAKLSEFLEQTHAALLRLDWTQQWTEIVNRIGDWADKVSAEFSRTLYLRWLEEIASTFSAERSPSGDHPYARVQLLTVPQAQGQEWSHLIFAGWNEGSWPPSASGEFAREDEIQIFNKSVQQLNRRAARQGSYGEGHISIREGHTPYLGPVEQRQIALRQFETLLESATEGTAFAASLVQESAPERFWNPNEIFTRLYQQTYRQPLTQAAMNKLQKATQNWLRSAPGLTSPAKLTPQGVEQTRVAFDARRDPLTTAGEYDFAFRSTPNRVPVLSVSEIERLVSSPALVWLKRYLGVEAVDDETNPWSAATGQWVHRWLAQIASTNPEKKFVPLPDASEIDRRIRTAAEQKCAEVKRLCHAAGKPVPDWWYSGWQNAFCLARLLGAKLATVEGWPWMAVEWTIDGEESIPVAQDASLSFKGRIDLLLARTANDSLNTDELWILDYKTGASKKALAPAAEDVEKRKSRLRKKLLDGSALQLGLYALAARHLGAREIFLSLLSPAIKPIEPQLSIGDMDGEADVFQELAHMQLTGIFGMRGPLRSAWTFTRAYPLATLAIEEEILEQRWENTHPALAQDEEEFFWR